ncbi:DUF2207 domain-containing protein [Evansella sp. AB-rgal1]|uniref:DUF2207 domain-containing protein n=1 Tax=Evansella sp. AB-rgal1 TaxID=3242696 RepID=UPI00359DB5D4
MWKKFTGVFILLLFLFFIPEKVFAVDYKITNVEINAYLQENGNVNVEERHTYSFNGEFNGIIREIIPNVDTEIHGFLAYEGNRSLLVETNETEYRIHRSGKDEVINVSLVYEIVNGVNKYSDVAEFYWSFFDRNNESTYENLIINVFPPIATSDVIAFGYDEAFEKERVREEGHVQFQLGRVPSGRNGDIRVAYDASLFPLAEVTSHKNMRLEIVNDKQTLVDNAIAWGERRDFLGNIGGMIISGFGIVFLVFVLTAWMKAKGKRRAIMQEISQEDLLPNQKLSMPATIYFTNYKQVRPETIAAALLDLVRQGYVEKIGDDQFQLVKRDGLLNHEEKLVRWLFDDIGQDGTFSFADLQAYTKVKSNHSKYQMGHSAWMKAVGMELKDWDLYETKGKFLGLFATLSILLVPVGIALAFYDLWVLFAVALGLCLVIITFALSYHPKTWVGAKIMLEWQRFKSEFPRLSSDQWLKFSEDDKMRAFIYGLGVNAQNLKKKNESLINEFKTSDARTRYHNQADPHTAYGLDPTWIIVAGAASTNFQSAQSTTTADTSSSGGSFSGGGSGAGGGGGGSGAF